MALGLVAIAVAAIVLNRQGAPASQLPGDIAGTSIRIDDRAVAGATAQPCPAALIVGMLVFDDEEGLALNEAGPETRRSIIWPQGYSARLSDGKVTVFSDTGEVVAREGDRVEIGGGEVGEGPYPPWLACGGLKRLPR